MLRIASAILCAVLVAASCATRATGSSQAVSFDDRQLTDIVLADSSEITPARQKGPRYPEAERAAHEENAFVAFFVVDTAGRPEPWSISFSVEARRAFITPVCEFLRTARFQPVMRGNQPRRALMLSPWVFAVKDGWWWDRSLDVQPIRDEVARRSVVATLRESSQRKKC